ncbi:MAG TPA: hypothetical protein VM261_20285 [Kofleriaceae bacterium]|nr:hypothetical protein [Kofleriaceae bacterium]
MRFEELQDDGDDEEWAAALIQAARDAEEDEWEWRIAMARAKVEREEPRIANLPEPPAMSPIPPAPRRRSVTTEAPPSVPRAVRPPSMSARSRAVTQPPAARPVVVIPPKP